MRKSSSDPCLLILPDLFNSGSLVSSYELMPYLQILNLNFKAFFGHDAAARPQSSHECFQALPAILWVEYFPALATVFVRCMLRTDRSSTAVFC